jgi:hypothetical protein
LQLQRSDDEQTNSTTPVTKKNQFAATKETANASNAAES